jgi:hypothetical protein
MKPPKSQILGAVVLSDPDAKAYGESGRHIMSGRMRVIQRAAQILTLAMLCACGADSPQGPGDRARLPNDPDIQRAATAVEKYILESKDWRKDQFWVEFKYREGPTVVFWPFMRTTPPH